MNPAAIPPPRETGKVGWPWTAADVRVPIGSRLPLVSVVTPSLNQAAYLEETIRSVLLQGYPNIEYTIIDGGSSDGSIDVIRHYEKLLSYWESNPDRGQADAIIKGWRRASGSIFAYLNSDDLYLPEAVATAVAAFEKHPEAVAICGGELLIDSRGYVMLERSPKSAGLEDLLSLNFLPQPSVFISQSALQQVGFPSISLKNAFDFDLWIRLTQIGRIICIKEILSATRIHPAAKTLRDRKQVATEIRSIIKTYLNTAGRSICSRSLRRKTLGRLSLLELEIALDHPLNKIRAIIYYSLAAGFLCPAFFPLIARRIFFRLRRSRGGNPWGLSSSDKHVSTWRPSKGGDNSSELSSK